MYPQSLSPVQQVDFALLLIFIFSGVMLVILTIITCYFIWRYNHKRNPTPTNIKGNVKAEIIWTLIPSLMVMGLFYYGWTGYQALRTVPSNAMNVKVTAKMFSWTFTYENGKTSNYLAVPVHTPVKLNMESIDVIHSLFIPAFRIKMDTVPGMKTYAWFSTEREGIFDIYCAEYCGIKHSAMLSTVRAMSQEEFDEWLTDSGPAESDKAGFAFMEAIGCFTCHDAQGKEIKDSPKLIGLYGSKRPVLINSKEQEVLADEAYIKESIVDPGKLLVKGYDNTMPAYTDITPAQMANIIDYLRSVGEDNAGEESMEHAGHTMGMDMPMPSNSTMLMDHSMHTMPPANKSTAPMPRGLDTMPQANGTQPMDHSKMHPVPAAHNATLHVAP